MIVGTRVRRLAASSYRRDRSSIWGSGWPGESLEFFSLFIFSAGLSPARNFFADSQIYYTVDRNAVITCGGAAPSSIIEGTRVRRIATTTNRRNRTKIWGSGWPEDRERAKRSAARVPPRKSAGACESTSGPFSTRLAA